MDKLAYRKRFGQVIRQLRMSKGWTQEKLADVLGWTRPYISMIEAGVRGIVQDEAVRLVNVLLDDKYKRELFIEFLEILANPSLQGDLGAIETLIKKAHKSGK